jgi:hypothetical protein
MDNSYHPKDGPRIQNPGAVNLGKGISVSDGASLIPAEVDNSRWFGPLDNWNLPPQNTLRGANISEEVLRRLRELGYEISPATETQPSPIPTPAPYCSPQWFTQQRERLSGLHSDLDFPMARKSPKLPLPRRVQYLDENFFIKDKKYLKEINEGELPSTSQPPTPAPYCSPQWFTQQRERLSGLHSDLDFPMARKSPKLPLPRRVQYPSENLFELEDLDLGKGEK